MRTNLPVTQSEYQFPTGQTLVSVTDLKGRITYCNPAFIEVSGYAKDELLGQPHNLVRHPDMPAEAFRDMWATIAAGLPWTGLVKNRRKNGDHYWVQANATPMKDGDRIAGFLSVRTQPTRQQVASAEALYATLRAEATEGRLVHVLARGGVLRQNLAGRLGRALQPGQRGVMLGMVLASNVAVGGAVALDGAWGWLALPAAAALATWALGRSLLKPLAGVVEDALRLAAGDLATGVRQGGRGAVGEMQQALMQLSVNLRTVVSDTRQQIEQLRLAAAEIASGNQELSERTESQASSLQQTAASMEEINTTVKNSSDAATQGVRLAAETTTATGRGDEAVQAVANAMTGINDSSKLIDEITRTVEGVAFQTNILALNAAVEAARAGEQGRGFAVVASEVRSLAQRSSQAAREIKQLIQQSAERVADGALRVGQAREQMQDVRHRVQQVHSTLEGISQAASEQQAGIAQINEAVSQMDSITQQNAAMVEELAAAALQLNEQVQEVDNSMRLFRLAKGERTAAEADAVQLRRVVRTPKAATSPAAAPVRGRAAEQQPEAAWVTI